MKKTLMAVLFFSMCVQAQEVENSEAAPLVEAEVTSETAPQDPSKLPKPLGRVKSTTGVNSESSSFMGDPDNIDPLNPRNESLKDDEEPVLSDIREVLDAPPPAPKEPAKSSKAASLPDDPDLSLEKKFNTIYKRYNSNPTPEDVWQAASSRQQQRQYVVQKGDTLWSISKILFGDANFWPKLWSLNKQGILNPHFIQPNTNIYFFAGDAQNSPTLSIGSPGVIQDSPAATAAAVVPYQVADNVIPESLPISRNDYYYTEKKREVTIQFKDLVRYPYEPVNDIVLTEAPVKTKIEIQMAEVSKFRCYNGRLVKNIRYTDELAGEYEIFSPVDTFKSVSGDLYAYRFYGRAVPYQTYYLKITDCRDIIATDLVILPKGMMQSLRAQKTSPSRAARLAGGPNVVSQKLFILHQKAYVDFGVFPYEVGEEYQVRSQVTDAINGKVRILDKYGAFAVVAIIQANDVMEIGDKLVLQR